MAKKPQHAQNNQRSQQGKQGQQQKRGGKAQGSRPTHAPTAPARPWRPGRDKFLPVSRADMDARGWDQCDFVYICGDATWITPALAWLSSAAYSTRTATK